MGYDRFKDAILVQGGCNLRGIARALVRAADQVGEETHNTVAVNHDPAVILIVAKLADMVGLDYTWPSDKEEECRQRAQHLPEWLT